MTMQMHEPIEHASSYSYRKSKNVPNQTIADRWAACQTTIQESVSRFLLDGMAHFLLDGLEVPFAGNHFRTAAMTERPSGVPKAMWWPKNRFNSLLME